MTDVGAWLRGAFASNPAVGKPAHLAQTPRNKGNFIYREDVAELFIRMCQAETLKHFAYNSGGHACSFEELASIVKEFIPEAQFSFGEPIEHAIAPFLVSDQRAVKEFGFKRRDLRQGILDHINEARKEANLPPIR